MVPRQHSGRAGHVSGEPLGLGRPAPPVAALESRPAARPCSPKPTGSHSAGLTACGRRFASIVNVRGQSGGKRALPLHPPGLPTGGSAGRGVRRRLLADLGRPVDAAALQPVARFNRRLQRPRSRSAPADSLSRSGRHADGRVGHHGSTHAKFVSKLCLKGLKLGPLFARLQ